MLGLALLLFGDSIFSALKIPPPPLYLQARDNKIQSFLILFIGVNVLMGMLNSTGAFEITVGQQLVFSKLQSGRMPTADELLANVRKALV